MLHHSLPGVVCSFLCPFPSHIGKQGNLLTSIVQVDISEAAVGASQDGSVPAEFTYSVKWTETLTPFDKRMDKYRRYQFLPQHLEVSVLQEFCLAQVCRWSACVHAGAPIDGRQLTAF